MLCTVWIKLIIPQNDDLTEMFGVLLCDDDDVLSIKSLELCPFL